MIFRRYLELGSVRALKAALDEEGVVSKQRSAADGSPYGGKSFSRGALYLMLQNRIYRGEIVHKGATYHGEHAPIIEEDLWSSVQLRLKANGVERREGQGRARPNLLTGVLFDASGQAMTPTHAVKKCKAKACGGVSAGRRLGRETPRRITPRLSPPPSAPLAAATARTV
jgi:site-specific DNA recombinase